MIRIVWCNSMWNALSCRRRRFRAFCVVFAVIGTLIFLQILYHTNILFTRYMDNYTGFVPEFSTIEMENISIVRFPPLNSKVNAKTNMTTHTENATTLSGAQTLDSTKASSIIPVANNATPNMRLREEDWVQQKRLIKDRLETLKRLTRLRIPNLTEQTIIQDISLMDDILPWSDVVARYGRSHKIIGLDTCEAYRKNVPLEQRVIGPAGLFHTGTNWIADLLEATCHMSTSGISKKENIVWQVPWGKHNPIEARLIDQYVISKPRYQAMNTTAVFPIVMVRHPVSWMLRMCSQPYAASWDRTTCPSLITGNQTKKMNIQGDILGEENVQYNPVRVRLYLTKNYNSLLHFWKDWNNGYYIRDSTTRNVTKKATTISNGPIPRLMVRLEDLVYHPEQVLKEICNCVGGKFVPIPFMLAQRRGGDSIYSQTSNKHFIVNAWKHHAAVALSDLESLQDQHVTEELLQIDGVNNQAYSEMLKELDYHLL